MRQHGRLYLRTLAVLAVTVVMGSAIAASASAAQLPSYLSLTEEHIHIVAQGAGLLATFLRGPAGLLKAVGAVVDFVQAHNMESLGTMKFELTTVEHEGTKCNTAGAAEGVVVFPSTTEWHLVLMLSGASNLFGKLILIPEVVIKCGALSIKVKGSLLLDEIPFGREVLESETFEAETGTCGGTGKTTPAFSEFDNDGGTMSTAKLESSVGLGFAQSCLEWEGKLKLKPSGMTEAMEP